jgi:hypothetical protein
MATRKKRRAPKAQNYMTAAGGCKFGKVKNGPRKGKCRMRKVGSRKKS